jgi:hypothetical protein
MLLENERDNATAESILHKLREVHNSTQEALRELRVPENLIQLNTAFYPEFDKLLPAEVTEIYGDIKKLSVLSLDAQGFSQREISRRLKGESHVAIRKVIKNDKSKK